MSQTLEQTYFNLLARIDHPVFAKDFSDTTTIDANSPLNSILNLIFAREMVGIRAMLDTLIKNSYPVSVDLTTINDWELQYFGFTKPQLSPAQRVSELLIKFNQRFHLSVGDVIALSQAIVGQTPVVVRNLFYGGFVLGNAVLGASTVFGGDSTQSNVYLVEFTKPVDSTLLSQLDQQLTAIEKAGSRHKIKAPIPYWLLGRSALGIDTIL